MDLVNALVRGFEIGLSIVVALAEALGFGVYQVLDDNHERFYAEGGRKA